MTSFVRCSRRLVPVLFVAFFALGSPLPATDVSPSGGEFDLQGHRGCAGLMPENTLPAYALAVEQRADEVRLARQYRNLLDEGMNREPAALDMELDDRISKSGSSIKRYERRWRARLTYLDFLREEMEREKPR